MMNLIDISETLLVFDMMVRPEGGEPLDSLAEFIDEFSLSFDFAMAVFVDKLTVPDGGLVDVTIRSTFTGLCVVMGIDPDEVVNVQDFVDRINGNG